MAKAQKTKSPSLRFKDEQGKGYPDWEERRLGEISKNVDYGIGSVAVDFDGENKYIRITDINDENNTFSPNPLCSPSGAVDEKYVLRKGDIVFARTGASVGKTYLYRPRDGRLIYAGYLIRFSIDSDKGSPEFIFFITLCSQYKSWVSATSARSGQPGINANEYKTYRFMLPCKKEQQKIASFLSSVDAKIEQLNKKKTLLEQYKKGMIQKLFSQEIRFKDEQGKDYPDWEEKKLDEMGKVYNGLQGKTKLDFGEGNHYLQYMQIFVNSKIDISKNGYVKILKYEKQNPVKYGDIFFTISSETPNEVGMSSVLLENVTDTYLNSFCFGYRLNSFEHFDPNFLSYFFRTKIARKEIVKLSQGSTRYNMSKNQFLKLIFAFPSLPEQQKIANFLSAIDKKIEFTAEQIKQAQIFKKGLLQQMFV